MKKLNLVDKSLEMCEAWRDEFSSEIEYGEVAVFNGDYFALNTDCIISPANSFGFMDGGLDLVITKKMGYQLQVRLQQIIGQEYHGELLVGQAHLMDTQYSQIPYCIAAPTMRIPTILGEQTVNPYLSSRAVFILLKDHPEIEVVTMPGMGTGAGRVSPRLCAKQMKKAYDDFWKGELRPPVNFRAAQQRHINLYSDQGYVDLQKTQIP